MNGRTVAKRAQTLLGWLYGSAIFQAIHAVLGLAIYIDVDVNVMTPFRLTLLSDALVSFALVLVGLMTWIVQLRWVYNSNKVAKYLSNDALSVSPGWSVGWFFVPILGLWMPFVGVRETYQFSVDPDMPHEVAVPLVFRWWWGLYLARAMVSYLALITLLGGERALPGSPVQVVNAVASAIAIPAALALAAVVRRISRTQAQSLSALAA